MVDEAKGKLSGTGIRGGAQVHILSGGTYYAAEIKLRELMALLILFQDMVRRIQGLFLEYLI